MRLRWDGTFDEWMSLEPFEAEINCLAKGSSQHALSIRTLERLAEQFRLGAREYDLRHLLIVERCDDVPIERTGLQCWSCAGCRTLGFRSWGTACSPIFLDGTQEVKGWFELKHGEPSGIDRFSSLVAQTARTIDQINRISSSSIEQELLITWMIDLYRSARHGLPGLFAEPRVSPDGKTWRPADLEPAPRSRVRRASFAVVTDGLLESCCWFAELEPDCFSASALKLEAVLSALSEVAPTADAEEVWRPASWFSELVPILNSETLRKAREKQVRLGVGCLKYRECGRFYEYEVGSVCQHWPGHADVLRSALVSGTPAA